MQGNYNLQVVGGRRIQTVTGKSETIHCQGYFQLRARHIVGTRKYLLNQQVDDGATQPGTQYLPGQDHNQTGEPLLPSSTERDFAFPPHFLGLLRTSH